MYNLKKRFLAVSLTVIFLATQTLGFGQTFSDMPPVGHYARVALELGVENGLISGYDGKIMPFGNVTRAQMAAIMNKVMGATEKASISAFSDVDPKAWYYDEMAKAVYLKIFLGSGNKLSPLSNITREQVCVVLANTFNLKTGDLTALNGFSDSAKISTWAKDGVAAMARAGYMNGKLGQLKPLDYITRAELAAILNNMVQTYLNEAGVYEGTFEGNVMINAPGVSFKDATIKGDLFIGDGFGSSELSLDGLIVTGRIVIKGSAMLAELELIEEEIALGSNTTPPAPPSPPTTTPTDPGTPPPPPTPPVVDNNTKLVALNTKLVDRVIPDLKTETQLEAIELIRTSIDKFLADATYDITADVAAAKILGAKMTADEYAYFKNTITGKIPLLELVALNNYFKIIEY